MSDEDSNEEKSLIYRGVWNGVWMFAYSIPGVFVSSLFIGTLPTVSIGLILTTVLMASIYVSRKKGDFKAAVVGAAVQGLNHGIITTVVLLNTTPAPVLFIAGAVGLILLMFGGSGLVGVWLGLKKDFTPFPDKYDPR